MKIYQNRIVVCCYFAITFIFYLLVFYLFINIYWGIKKQGIKIYIYNIKVYYIKLYNNTETTIATTCFISQQKAR